VFLKELVRFLSQGFPWTARVSFYKRDDVLLLLRGDVVEEHVERLYGVLSYHPFPFFGQVRGCGNRFEA
jgi:hypothetical protein